MTKGGKKRYLAMVRRKGRPLVSQTFPNKTLAKEWAKKVEGEIASTRFLRRIEEEKHTLSEAIDRFIAENLSELSEQEQKSRRTHLNWWRDRLGSLSLAAVTPAAITEARAALLDRVSGATSNRYLAALSAVLTLAEKEWEWLSRNPVSKVRRRAESRGRVRFLSDDERKRLLKACEASHDRRLHPLVLFALTTGARQGELLGLRWEDVDLENARARLQKTKNKDRRSISFPGSAGEVLREMAKAPHDSGYLFANGDGLPTFSKKPWLAALNEAKIDDFRFHDLRHTAASYLAMSGATLPELAAFLGHRTLAMVQRYAHLTESHSESVAQRMAQQFLSD